MPHEPADPAIGSHWPFDIKWEDSPPPRAEPVPCSACEAADAYVKLIAADRASEVPGLFAEDGVFIGPGERVYRGRAEIAEFYNAVHQGGAIPLSFIDRGCECVMELAGMRPADDPSKPDHYRLVAIDHFTVGPDGKIQKLVIFIRPGANPQRIDR
jgi:hypothetical protein